MKTSTCLSEEWSIVGPLDKLLLVICDKSLAYVAISMYSLRYHLLGHILVRGLN